MSDDAEPTKAQLQMELDVCRNQAAELLEYHKSVVRGLIIIFSLVQIAHLGWVTYGILAR